MSDHPLHSGKAARWNGEQGSVRALIEVYRATTYCADIPGAERLALRVAQPSAALDRLLDAEGCTTWAYVTACNPGSRELPAAENRERQTQLIAHAAAHGWNYYTGDGIPDTPGWTPEPSLLILGISESDAIALGRAFGQVAILTGTKGGVPQLRLCKRSAC